MLLPTDSHLLYRAVQWSAASIGWSVVASGCAIVVGVSTGSLLLVVFGAAGALDMVGSVALFAHFRHAVRQVSRRIGRSGRSGSPCV